MAPRERLEAAVYVREKRGRQSVMTGQQEAALHHPVRLRIAGGAVRMAMFLNPAGA